MTNAGISTKWWLTCAAVGVSLSTAGTAAAAPAPILDDSASIDLLDDAIDAIESGDSDAYDLIVDRALQGEVWLPLAALDDLEDRDIEDLINWSEVLGEAPTDLPLWAVDAVEYERDNLNRIPLAGDSTPELTLDISEADEIGVGLLELIDRRGLEIPASARTVLESLDSPDGSAPDDEAYVRAIEDLRALDAAIATVGPAVSAADPIATPATDAEPVDQPDDETVQPTANEPIIGPADVETSDASGIPEASDSAAESENAAIAPAPNRPPAATPSSDSNSLLVFALLGVGVLAVAAVALSLRTALRGRKHDRLADMAFTDGLTGLKNRRRMDADIAEQETLSRPTATLMVDVDHFKLFNDTHGHSVGDEVLRLVGETLSKEFRKTDVPYRYGGEEFCVLLPDTTESDAVAAGERARVAIENIELPIDGNVTASIGVSIGPATSITETIERADSALYLAKEGGRNRVAFA